MPTALMNLGMNLAVLTARTGTGASATFALPSSGVRLTWQTTFDIAPAVINITIDISLDGTNWTVLDTTTNVNGETRVIAALSSANFVRANVVTNTGNRAVTLTLLGRRDF
jgi:hypothetical protein